MPLIITKPAQTLSGIPGTYKTGIVIPASSSSVIDSLPAINNYSVKWIITLIDSVNSKTNTSEILAINKFNTSVSHNSSSRVGDHIAHGINVQLNAGNIELILLNNETNNIMVSVVRIQMVHS